jgi:hypothetical protein
MSLTLLWGRQNKAKPLAEFDELRTGAAFFERTSRLAEALK